MSRGLPQYDPARLEEYLRAAGLKALNPLWARAEILLGLSAAGAGLKILPLAGAAGWAGVALFALGGYLAMAGHRSHLYQSQNRMAAYLLQERPPPPDPG